ncbi:glycine cleavage system protein H [Kosmotoga sp. DU53]|uniref:glycine cleavage system protein H n=1 Tax=Kosmotoga sp. DU53 TaxID=1310160 RepID=UPI0007C469C2|nr:biotin/lipoyl-containing protein [Kosmotoga sp. DU53]MDK2953694.1 glycine cleavage system protein [Kosmotoga sp.]OAA21127.1 glycine cleavage system protein H [Kosmotoga sp. DU53]
MRKYTKENLWIEIMEKEATIGVTSELIEESGDVTYVQLPEIGTEVKREDSLFRLETAKSVVDVNSPLTGKVIEINSKVDEDPDIINTDPENEGWLVKLEILVPSEINDLLDEKP